MRRGAHTALTALREDYWLPLYHFALAWAKTPGDAEDLTRAFLSHFQTVIDAGDVDAECRYLLPVPFSHGKA